jgi:hypothetical protein
MKQPVIDRDPIATWMAGIVDAIKRPADLTVTTGGSR